MEMAVARPQMARQRARRRQKPRASPACPQGGIRLDSAHFALTSFKRF
jgi:hypothetical protein